jgi:sugar (pentulose or hexulose) kinase
MPLLLGLDIGTTSTIGTVIDAEGRMLAVESRPATLHSDHPNWAEEDPEEWWANVGAICRALLAREGIGAAEIAAVGATGMLPTVVLIDEALCPLRRSIQQNDARATVELEEMRGRMPEERFLALSGTGYSQQLIGPKLEWLRRHEPGAFGRARKVVGASDFITARLTGAVQVEHNWALEAGFVNIATGGYDPELIELAGIDPALLAPVRPSQEVVGGIAAEAARHTGLAPGTPVVAGCADHVASAFICGAALNGDLVLKFGGAGDILLSVDRPTAGSSSTTISCPAFTSRTAAWRRAAASSIGSSGPGRARKRRRPPRRASPRTSTLTDWHRPCRMLARSCSCPMCWARRRRSWTPMRAEPLSDWGCIMGSPMSGARRSKASRSASATMSRCSPSAGLRRPVSLPPMAARQAIFGCRLRPTC